MRRIIWPTTILAVVVALLFLATAMQPKKRALTFDGLAPVLVGMSVPEAETALGAKLAPLNTSDGMSSTSCWYTRRADGVDQTLAYMVRDGHIVRIDVNDRVPGKIEAVDPGVTTERGVGIGSSEDEVKKAYGSSLDTGPHQYGDEDDHYMTILTADKKHGLLFETWDGKVSTFRTGTPEAITLSEGCS